MISVSHFSRRFEITLSLSATFAPPRIATNGRSGFSTALPRYSISLSIRYPTAFSLTKSVTPTVEQCALCAVPKASFTYISQRDARSLENASAFFSSSGLNLAILHCCNRCLCIRSYNLRIRSKFNLFSEQLGKSYRYRSKRKLRLECSLRLAEM